MNKMRIMALALIVLAMIPLTYIIGRGGHRGGRGYHHGGHGYHHSRHGYRHGGYYGRGYYNPAWWAVPTAVGIAATAAAASSSDNSSNESDYYPDEPLYEE